MTIERSSIERGSVTRRLVRTTVVLGFTAIAIVGPVGGTAGAGGDPSPAVTMVLAKDVVGTAPAGSSVALRCENNNALVFDLTFGFDAEGNATTSDAPDGYATIVNGDFVIAGSPKEDVSWTCYATEVDTGGATSTSFTCDYDAGDNPAEGVGCSLASDPSTGAAKVLFATPGDVKIQVAQITFTNTYVAVAGAEVVPTFTG